LRGANLSCADLTGANLRAATLFESNLNYAYLTNANLINANLQRTNLTHTNFTDADMRGADLRMLVSAQSVKGIDLQVINMPKHPIVRYGTQVAMFTEEFHDIDYWIANYRKFGKLFAYTAEELKLYKQALLFIKKTIAITQQVTVSSEID
jgi:uncharacterized protein YjbI with pentapeptide repeats